ncbi:MAG: phasin family protein [Bacteroidota bacterium]
MTKVICRLSYIPHFYRNFNPLQIMDERMKSLLYMAVGLASASDKARRLLDKMSIEGKMSEEEGKRIIHELFHSGAEAGTQMKDEMMAKFYDLLMELQIPSQKDFAELSNRVKQLEDIIHTTQKPA